MHTHAHTHCQNDHRSEQRSEQKREGQKKKKKKNVFFDSERKSRGFFLIFTGKNECFFYVVFLFFLPRETHTVCLFLNENTMIVVPQTTRKDGRREGR